MVPVYAKPNTPKRRKRPGARNGHPGTRREKPTQVDRRQSHRLKRGPHCEGPLPRCRQTRKRIIEDIPQDLRVETTEHTIARDYCPACHKHVEPVIPDALSRATLGHRVRCLTAWWHYGLGVTIDQIVEILRFHLQIQRRWRPRITPGGLLAMWRPLGDILNVWYEQIAEGNSSAVCNGIVF